MVSRHHRVDPGLRGRNLRGGRLRLGVGCGDLRPGGRSLGPGIGQLRFKSGDPFEMFGDRRLQRLVFSPRLVRRGRRQGDAADVGDPQLVAAGVLQPPGVTDPANLDVGDRQRGRGHEVQFGLRQPHGVGNQLAHRAVDRFHGGGGAAGVPEQRGVGHAAVHDVGEVDGVGTGQRDLHLVEVGEARIEHFGGDHHLGRLMGSRHHRVHPGLRGRSLGGRCPGSRLGGLNVGHCRLDIRHGGLGVGHCRLGFRPGGAYRRGRVGFRLGDGCRGSFRGGRRQGNPADVGDLQLVAAGVLQRAGVTDAADLDVGDRQRRRGHEVQLGLRQPHGVGDQLAHRAVDRFHGSGGAAGVPEQRGVGHAAVHDVGEVDGIGTGQRNLHLVEIGEARIEHFGGNHHLGRLMVSRHHRVHLGLRGRSLRCRCLGGRLGGLSIGHGRFSLCHGGFSLRHGGIGRSLRVVGRGLGGGQFGFERGYPRGRRRGQRGAADSGYLQPVAADVLKFTRVASAANVHVGDHEPVRREEGQFRHAQVYGIGNQLAVVPEDSLHRSGGAALVLQQGRIGLAAVPDG